MGKTIIITAGPTNEKVDEVMQITNMSTGRLGCVIAEKMLSEPYFFDQIDKIYFLCPKLAHQPENHWGDKLQIIYVTDTESLLNTLGYLLRNPAEHIDAVIHSAAVGDYKGRYAARAEDVAAEIARETYEALQDSDPMDENKLYNIAMGILANPTCVQNSNTKISSYEPNLMVMLDLTPKVINSIKQFSPDTMLIGFKLLKGVSKQHLFDIGSALLDRTGAYAIVANDLGEIGDGKHKAMIIGHDNIVDRNAIFAECETKNDIANEITKLVFGEPMAFVMPGDEEVAP